MFLAPLYALVVIRQNLGEFKKLIEDINVYVTNSTAEVEENKSSLPLLFTGDPQNVMHVFMQRATCVKHMNKQIVMQILEMRTTQVK